MTITDAGQSALTNGRAAADTIRGKVVEFRSAALPRAASAAETAGEAVSRMALSTSKGVAGALRNRMPSKSTALSALLPAAPLLRGAARFALRNPVVLVAAGLGVAAFGYAAWRRQHSAGPEPVVEPQL